MCNFGIYVNDKFEGDNIKSSIEFLQGRGNFNTQDEAMNYGFRIKVSRECLEDTKALRYISNLMKNQNVDVSININEISVEFKITYENHVHINTISELNSCVEANINSVTRALNVFEIHEYEVISLFYIGNKPLEIENILM
ncbi:MULTISPECIES: hypothetical protein [Clostridium]|uniref:Uncharacterized protein n=1 Tax=Clostridium beijerinckii TaxID=1520 RepID=A0A7X9SSQ6_CLOBE|nr:MULTISPECIES: hypothetical protein [Clostridium]NMF07326.1 hypothetical protein [Clostridium beijerinckii]